MTDFYVDYNINNYFYKKKEGESLAKTIGIGYQNFADIISDGVFYIDKTDSETIGRIKER